MRVARELGMPLQRLGEEMTAEEFSLWIEFINEEPLQPGAQVGLAGLLAAIHNGLLAKKGGGSWSISDFMPRLWVNAARKPAPPSAADLRRHARGGR